MRRMTYWLNKYLKIGTFCRNRKAGKRGYRSCLFGFFAVVAAIGLMSFGLVEKQVFALSQQPKIQVATNVTGYSYQMKLRNGRQPFANNVAFSIIYADGHVVFCVEPAVKIDTHAHYQTVTLEDGVLIDKRINNRITTAQIDRIKNIIFWGWDMSPVKNIQQYALVQSAVWRAVGWDFAKLTGNGISIDKVIALENQVEQSSKGRVSFDQQEVVLRPNEEKVLTDQNRVLKYLSFKNRDGWEFEKVGNQLTIKALPNAIDTTITSVNDMVGEKVISGAILLAEGSQTIVAFKDPNRLVARLRLRLIKDGGIKIIKRDSETQKPLANVTFGLFEDQRTQPIATGKTNQEGIVTFQKLSPKRYFIKELETLSQYRLKDALIEANVNPGETTTISVENERKSFQIHIKKWQDSLFPNGTKTVGSGIVFDVISTESNQIVETMVTNDRGEAISKKLPITLKKYVVKERVPNGYIAQKAIELMPDASIDGKIYYYTIENHVKKSQLKVVKIDAETKRPIPIANTAFQLYKDDKMVSVNHENEQTFVTDQTGKVTFPYALPYGQYLLKEVRAPKGYVLSDKPIPIVITGEDAVVTVSVENQPQKGQLIIKKTGEAIINWKKDAHGVFQAITAQKPLSGVTFALFNHTGKEVDRVTTNDKGFATFSKQPLGVYTYREIDAPNGYVADQTNHAIVFDAVSPKIAVNRQEKTHHNHLKRKKIVLKKDFEQSLWPQLKKQQATFGLFTKHDISGLPKDSLVGKINVDGSQQQYTLEGLPLEGTFYWKELATASFYQINKNLIDVVLTSEKSVDTISVHNQLKRGKVIVKKQNANDKQPIPNVEFRLDAILNFNERKTIGHYRTDEKGEIQITELEFGQYEFSETNAANGYLKLKQPISFEVTEKEQLIQLTIENELVPHIKTTAVSHRNQKNSYVFETHKEQVFLNQLTIGKTYRVVAKQFDRSGKEYARQEREFVASSPTETLQFDFVVPKDFSGYIVYGEELYQRNDLVASHFDLMDDQQTILVLNPKIKTIASYQTSENNIIDRITYQQFKNEKVIVKTWLVKQGTNVVIGNPQYKTVQLNGEGVIEVVINTDVTNKLPSGNYTVMEQIYEWQEGDKLGKLITEHTDPNDKRQTVTIKRPNLPKTNSNHEHLIILGSMLFILACLIKRLQTKH